MPLGVQVKKGQDEAQALCRHGQLQVAAAELPEEGLGVFSGLDRFRRLFLFSERRRVCQDEPLLCGGTSSVCSVSEDVELAAS